MKIKNKNTITQKSMGRVAIGTGIILLIPLFANVTVQGWSWGLVDFIIMGALIFSMGCAYLIISSMVEKKYRIIVAVALLFVFLVIWSELAVGAVSQAINWLS